MAPHSSTLVEFFWVFQRKALQEDAYLQHALNVLDAAPNASWQRYDLNSMGRWKPYKAIGASVDAQTQRTALMRFEGEDGALGVLALGKHGEPPTLVVRARLDDLAAARRFASSGADTPALRSFGAVGVAARDAYQAEGHGLHRLGDLDLVSWITGAAVIDERAAKSLQEAGVERLLDEKTTCFSVLPSFELTPPEACERWRALAESLSGLPVAS